MGHILQSVCSFRKSAQSEECSYCDTKNMFTDRAWKLIKSRKAAWSECRWREQREWEERGKK